MFPNGTIPGEYGLNWQVSKHSMKCVHLSCCVLYTICPWHTTILQWRHNGRDGVSNHQTHDCLLNRVFRRRSKNTWKLRLTGLCAGNPPVTGEFPAQMASNAENVSLLMTSSWNADITITLIHHYAIQTSILSEIGITNKSWRWWKMQR